MKNLNYNLTKIGIFFIFSAARCTYTDEKSSLSFHPGKDKSYALSLTRTVSSTYSNTTTTDSFILKGDLSMIKMIDSFFVMRFRFSKVAFKPGSKPKIRFLDKGGRTFTHVDVHAQKDSLLHLLTGMSILITFDMKGR